MLDEMRKYARDSWIPVILDDSLAYIKERFKNKKFGRILEIGTAIGYSSICFIEFLSKDGVIDTIELDKQRAMIAKVNIEMYNLNEKINIIEGDAFEILPQLTEKYDFIFMDGPKSHYIQYLPLCLNLLNKNGIILADNVTYKGMVMGPKFVRHKQRTAVTKLREFLDMVENDKSIDTELLEIGDGLLFISKKEE